MTRLQPSIPAAAVRCGEIAGFALLSVAVLWWAVVYLQVMNNTGFPIARTLPCLLYTSDRCSLAMALCKEWHFLGIKRYSTGLLWCGFAVSSLALALGVIRSRPGTQGNPPPPK